MVLEDVELLWKELWDVWDLRAFIILSLLLQTFLTLFASLRKRMPNNSIIIPLWSAYLLADWAANVAVGLISNTKGNTSGAAGDNEDLLAFWATFLMVHLGGPDTITAFAVEDNELWLRHLLALIVQSLAALYLFLQSLPGNKLYIPTMLMFFVGIIKYSERVRSLYLASLVSLRDSIQRDPDPGADFAMIMDEYMNNEINQIQVQIDEDPDKEIESDDEEAYNCALTELQMIQHAYHYFNISKGFIVDSILNIDQRNRSQQLFRITSPEQASRVIEVELSFMYEFLYTKVKVVHCKLGYFCRFVSFSSLVIALVIFCSENKQGYQGFDVGITYVLLLGAIVLDIIAIIMLLFSNWTIIALSRLPAGIKSDGKSLRAKTLGFLLTFKRGGVTSDLRNRELLDCDRI
ncbi:uncharacterized protein LOC132305387 [Cornus florida]|uniref:uncharacterized protein LOC132305387 n=1 Tax=Cornus florida TaxID=4283 RepID=UPI00289D81D3|nr:uncharacterized protein LOC132305387 [Cornus florida]